MIGAKARIEAATSWLVDTAGGTILELCQRTSTAVAITLHTTIGREAANLWTLGTSESVICVSQTSQICRWVQSFTADVM